MEEHEMESRVVTRVACAVTANQQTESRATPKLYLPKKHQKLYFAIKTVLSNKM